MAKSIRSQRVQNRSSNPAYPSLKNATRKPTIGDEVQLINKEMNIGLVGINQLKSIQSSLDAKPIDATCSSVKGLRDSYTSNATARLTENDAALVNTVLQQVINMNREKLSEASLMKVLTTVYKDATNLISQKNVHTEEINASSEEQNPTKTGNSMAHANLDLISKRAYTPNVLTVGERKRLQWEKERAELAALTVRSPWSSKLGSDSVGRSRVLTQSEVASTKTTKPVSNANNQTAITEATSFGRDYGVSLPALTPSGFAASQEANLMKREEQRRLWKSDLDEQVRQQQLLQQTKELLDSQSQYPVQQQVMPTAPNKRSLAAHPSASHFASSTFVPTVPVSSTTTPISAISDASVSKPCVAVVNPSPKVTGAPVNSGFPNAYNRVRGFTQQMYDDNVDLADRQRRAQEIQKAHLEQIEERRRLREEEKARKLEDDRREEARIAEEQARLQALTELEDTRRITKLHQEEGLTRQLHEKLQESKEKAARDRHYGMRHSAPKTAVHSPSQLQQAPSQLPTTSAASRGYDLSQLHPGEPEHTRRQTECNVTAQSVSSAVQTCCLEDAMVQTDPIVNPSTNSTSLSKLTFTQRDQAKKQSSTFRKLPRPEESNQKSTQRKPLGDARYNQTRSDLSTATGKHEKPNRSDKCHKLRAYPSQHHHPSVTCQQPPKNKHATTSKVSSTSEGQLGSSELNRLNTIASKEDGYVTRIPVRISGGSFGQEKCRSYGNSSIRPDCKASMATCGPNDVVRTDDVLAPSPTRRPYFDQSQNPVFSPKLSDDMSKQRQDAILRHLSDIRKGLQLRQVFYESESD